MAQTDAWPPLPWDEWKDTCDTLHMWLQVVGKVKLRLMPFLNELWQVAFYVTPRGLTTAAIPSPAGMFEVKFDFIDHSLAVLTSEGFVQTMPLMGRPVAEFYDEIMSILQGIGLDVAINTLPTEVPDPIPFEQDRIHAAYDRAAVERWWRIMLGTTKALQRYRSPFVGKSSPILFYWGSFDLNNARYSGRPAPPLQGVPRFVQIAEDRENVACGFWPGNPNAAGVALGTPAFYSYSYPAPQGFKDAPVKPDAAYYDHQLGEFVLRYEDARLAANPEQAIRDFFQSVYEAAATLGHWDRESLEQEPPRIG